MKRGQVTIFILISIVILIAAVLIIYVFIVRAPESVRQQAVVLSAETAEVEQYMISCLERVTENAAYAIALHGGFLNPTGALEWGESGDGVPSKSHFFLADRPIPTIVDGSTINLRSRSEIERMLERYIVVEVAKCDLSPFVDRFEMQKPDILWQSIDFDFTKASVPYSVTKVSASARIFPESISVTLSYPLLLTTESSRFELNTFAAQIPLRLGLVHSIAEKLAQHIAGEQPYMITENCDEYSSADGLVNVYLLSNPTRQHDALRVIDAQPVTSKLSEPLAFQFAVKNVEVSGACVG